MSDTLMQVLALLERNDVRISDHGYDELAADDIYVNDIFEWSPKGCCGGRVSDISERSVCAGPAEGSQRESCARGLGNSERSF